jgi:hypothetical protein
MNHQPTTTRFETRAQSHPHEPPTTAVQEWLSAVEDGREPPSPPLKPPARGLPPGVNWTSRPSPDDDGVVDAELVEDLDEELPGDTPDPRL